MANERRQRIDLPELNGPRGSAQLEIRTYKSTPHLASLAHVHFAKDGYVTFELFGDFSKSMVRSFDRATQKNLDAQHARVFTPQAIADLKAEAIAFYAAKRSKAAA